MNQENKVNSEQCEVDSVKREVDSKKPEDYFFRASAADFKKIPGSPIAYWASEEIITAFQDGISLTNISIPRQGLATMDNNRFTRVWHEVSLLNSSILLNNKNCQWHPYNKGGDYRKWYGNQEFVVNWGNNGKAIKQLAISRYGSASKRVVNENLYFQPSITWGKISSSKPSFRLQPEGAIFDVAGMSLFPKKDDFYSLLPLLNSKLVLRILELLSPTLNFEAGQIGSIPVILSGKTQVLLLDQLIALEKSDWDSYETSWNFRSLPLLQPAETFQTLEQNLPNIGNLGEKVPDLGTNASNHWKKDECRQCLLQTLEKTYAELSNHWKSMTLEMQRLEEENNRIFIDAYGLQDELTPEVPLKEITLTCNPHYRYKGDKTEAALEALQQQDTMKEFISYAVGCMFGRYSLDKPGLILANAGETLEDYLQQIPDPSFMPDDDNVVPLMDVDWFEDDIAERFKTFLKMTFGEENYDENLTFIEEALGYKPTGKRKPLSIRDYFLKSFYTDHIKTYKKRPIYWMFSSKKGTFNALVYLHRYRPETINDLLNEYVREFGKKLTAHRDNKMQESITAEGRTKVALEKEITKLNKQIEELNEYERDLFTFASQPAEALVLDLDDGVKVNYKRFSPVLKKVTGLS